MKFHGIDTQGEIYIQRLSTLPGVVPDADDEGRILYTLDTDTLYFAAESGGSPIWQPVSFETGTVMLFGQNSAPIGWTRKSDWADNSMLCYAAVGNINNGGVANPQEAHVHDNNAGHDHSFTLTENNLPPHQHTVNPPEGSTSTNGNHTHTSSGSATTSSNGNHSHTVNPPSTNTDLKGNHAHISGKASTDAAYGTVSEYWPYGELEPCGNPPYPSPCTGPKIFTTSTNGNHIHSVNIAQFNSGNSGMHTHTINFTSSIGNGGDHNHSVNIAQFNSGITGGGILTTTSAEASADTGLNDIPLYQEVIAAEKD